MASIAREILTHDRLRFLITVFSLALALILAVWGTGILFGTLGESVNLLDRAGADLWVLEEGYTTLQDPSSVPDAVLAQARALPGVRAACPLSQGAASLTVAESHPVLAIGIEADCPLFQPWDVRQGDAGLLAEAGTIIVDDFALRRDPARPGDTVTLNGQPLRLAAVTHYNKGFFTPYVFLSRTTLVPVGGGAPDQASFLAIQLEPGADAGAVRRALLGAQPGISVVSAAELRGATCSSLVSNGMGQGIGMMVFVGLLVAVLIITLTVYTATTDKLRDFAILKAIGTDNARLLRVILSQAEIQGLAGLAAGVGLSLLVDALVSRYVGMVAVFSPTMILVFLAAVALLSLLGALLSVRKVLTVDPLLVFRA